PMSQHRAALAAILVAVVAIFALSVVPATAAPPAPTNPLVAAAIGYDGTWQGECWAFVKKIVREATGQQMGFDYRQGYFDAGAVEIADPGDAQPGDIIQMVRDSDSGPNADYPGLHNGIIVENLGGGLFNIIDSNRDFDGVVHQRKNYSPSIAAARYGLNFHIYRIAAGATAKSAPGIPTVPSALTAPAPGQVLLAGDRARVYTPGDVLNLRSGAGRDASVKAILAHGTPVTVLSGPTLNSGLTWLKVSTPSGEGWVAAEFLTKDAAVTPSSAGAVTPVLQYRSFIPLAASD
ncbi:MAG: SH3 domain-containing protein, partial [Anaerolineaceae bacterium]